ncbi:MAG: hypothetical protein OEZ57_02905 [Nitrospirota bacterium]|nr:hypothetical protein [Nitrospirota bacterium]
MGGAPDPSYSPDHEILEGTGESKPPFITLQIDQVMEFSDAQGNPVEFTTGTYQLTPTLSNHLQFVATETQEAHVVRATTFHHAEPLLAPSTLLIKDAENPASLHLLLFLPDGQGLDAEGLMKGVVRSRSGKIPSSSAFSPRRRYTGVILQQGRVALDDDFKEPDARDSSKSSASHLNPMPSIGRVTLEQGRLHLDAKARQSLIRRCRSCVKKP